MQIREYGKPDAPRLLLLGQGARNPTRYRMPWGDRFHTILPVLPAGGRRALRPADRRVFNDRYGGRVYAIVSTSTAPLVARRPDRRDRLGRRWSSARQDDPRALVAEMVGPQAVTG